MGEIAEMMLDGILDEQTGEFIDDEISRSGGCGYPRTMQPNCYNSIKKRKSNRNVKHALKGESLGGLHLVGKKATIENIGECEIVDYVGKRGKKRYVLIDINGKEHRVKFNRMTLCIGSNNN